MAECAKSVLRCAERGTRGVAAVALVTEPNDDARSRSTGNAGSSSEERIHSATSGWGGSPKGVGGSIRRAWRSPLNLTKNPKRRSDPRFVGSEVRDHAVQDLVQVHPGL